MLAAVHHHAAAAAVAVVPPKQVSDAVAAGDDVGAVVDDGTFACADRTRVFRLHNPFSPLNCIPSVLCSQFYSCDSVNIAPISRCCSRTLVAAAAAVLANTMQLCDVHCNRFCCPCNPAFCNVLILVSRAIDFAPRAIVDCTCLAIRLNSCRALRVYCDHFVLFALHRADLMDPKNH